ATPSPAIHTRSLHDALPISKQNYTLDSIPSNNERVYLKGQSNISAGGDPIDVTDEITPEIKAVAINAVQAIPGLHQGGVDVLIQIGRAPSELQSRFDLVCRL